MNSSDSGSQRHISRTASWKSRPIHQDHRRAQSGGHCPIPVRQGLPHTLEPLLQNLEREPSTMPSSMLMRAAWAAAALGAVLGSSLVRAEGVVLLHGDIYTRRCEAPWVQALALKNGRIEAVGSDAEIGRYRAGSRIIDLKGRT